MSGGRLEIYTVKGEDCTCESRQEEQDFATVLRRSKEVDVVVLLQIDQRPFIRNGSPDSDNGQSYCLSIGRQAGMAVTPKLKRSQEDIL